MMDCHPKALVVFRGIEEGIKETIDWYVKNRNDAGKRYISFNDPAMKKRA